MAESRRYAYIGMQEINFFGECISLPESRLIRATAHRKVEKEYPPSLKRRRDPPSPRSYRGCGGLLHTIRFDFVDTEELCEQKPKTPGGVLGEKRF